MHWKNVWQISTEWPYRLSLISTEEGRHYCCSINTFYMHIKCIMEVKWNVSASELLRTWETNIVVTPWTLASKRTSHFQSISVYNAVLQFISYISLYLSLYRWIWHHHTFCSISQACSCTYTAYQQSTDAGNCLSIMFAIFVFLVVY